MCIEILAVKEHTDFCELHIESQRLASLSRRDFYLNIVSLIAPLGALDRDMTQIAAGLAPFRPGGTSGARRY